jgi:catechol 2,3-dioxygenase-like lactoylglutathione lyase family enzyme
MITPMIARLARGAHAAIGVTLLLGGSACSAAHAPPPAQSPPASVASTRVPEAERTPVDIRRTTLVVRDIERSLPLYRDALGLKVIYDQKIGPGPGPDGKPAPPTVRLVLLRANDTFIGALGLMQRLNVPPPPLTEPHKAMAGQAIVVMNVVDLDERFARVRAVPGVTVSSEPEKEEYPSADGKGKIDVIMSGIYDPDGFFIELNHLLGKPAGSTD